MIWKATYIDNTVDYEYLNGKETKFSEIKKDKLESFSLIETGNNSLFQFSTDDGILHVDNLNLEKLASFNGGEFIKFIFNSDIQKFVISPESLETYNSIVIKDSSLLDCISFDRSGKFKINGDELYMGLEIEGKSLDLLNGDIVELIHTKMASTDFYGKANNPNPYRKSEHVTGYTLGYIMTYNFGDLQITLSFTLIYDVIQKCVQLKSKIRPNKTISCNVCIYLKSQVSKLNGTLLVNTDTTLDRIITQI